MAWVLFNAAYNKCTHALEKLFAMINNATQQRDNKYMKETKGGKIKRIDYGNGNYVFPVWVL